MICTNCAVGSDNNEHIHIVRPSHPMKSKLIDLCKKRKKEVVENGVNGVSIVRTQKIYPTYAMRWKCFYLKQWYRFNRFRIYIRLLFRIQYPHRLLSFLSFLEEKKTHWTHFQHITVCGSHMYYSTFVLNVTDGNGIRFKLFGNLLNTWHMSIDWVYRQPIQFNQILRFW